jgi:hypothetical protein
MAEQRAKDDARNAVYHDNAVWMQKFEATYKEQVPSLKNANMFCKSVTPDTFCLCSQEKQGRGLMTPKAHPKAAKRAMHATREAEDRQREKKHTQDYGPKSDGAEKRRKKERSLGD